MKEEQAYDLVVLGGGPGGYGAAIRGAQLGARVALVEQDQVGGTCTNRGCIPTKALAASAHLLDALSQSEALGVRLAGKAELDFGKIAERRDAVVAELRGGIESLLKANRVELIRGRGTLDGPGRFRVGEKGLAYKKLILATGSRPAQLPMLQVDGRGVVDSDQLLGAKELPLRLVVVGGGVIGCEFASIYRSFGVEVQVIELLDRLLPTMELQLGKLLKRAMSKRGVGIRLKTAVQGVRERDDGAGLEVLLPEGEDLECDQVLVAVGRQAASADLGLAEAGLSLDRGCVLVDEHMFSGVEGIYAIGDLVGKTWLAHTAAHEGEVAAACALGETRRMRYDAVPGVVFTQPEIAAVGLSSAQAKEQGLAHRVGKFLYRASGKALCDGHADGRVELICAEEDGRILGGWIVGPGAGCLIAELGLAVDQGLSATQVAHAIHAHPTMPEMVAEAAADAMGMAIHRAPARKRRG